MERNKVLLVGLDGAPYDLVKRWVEEGELPNLRELIRAGSFGTLRSEIDETPPAWSSIYTGMNAGKHGVFDFQFRTPGTHEFTPINATQRDGKDVWELLSEKGFRVGVLNAPIAYPARQVNGVLVAGFLTPGEQVNYTYPEGLKDELKKAIPGFRHSSPDEMQLNIQKKKYVQAIYDKVENLGKAARYLMGRESFDFFSLIISETDHVQHWFWDRMEEGEGEYADVVLNTYKTADRALGDVIGACSKDTRIMVVSDHGATRLRRLFHTNYFLHSIGMLQFNSGWSTKVKRWSYSVGLTEGLFRLVTWTKVFPLRYLFRPLYLTLKDVDWKATRAYSFGYGQIYLNDTAFVGPTPDARPGNDDTKRAIIRALLEVVDEETGKRPVVRAAGREELFKGPHTSEAPDIRVFMAEGYEAFPWASISDRVFSPNTSRSGTHNQRGIVIMKGEGIKVGEMSDGKVTDVAPTILHLMGLPIPAQMDGHVLSQAFTEEHRLSHPVVLGEAEKPSGEGEKKGYTLSTEEEAVIEKNLRSLGYL